MYARVDETPLENLHTWRYVFEVVRSTHKTLSSILLDPLVPDSILNEPNQLVTISVLVATLAALQISEHFQPGAVLPEKCDCIQCENLEEEMKTVNRVIQEHVRRKYVGADVCNLPV